MSGNVNHGAGREGRLKALARYRELLAPRAAGLFVCHREIDRLCLALGRKPDRVSADAAVFRNHRGFEALARNLPEAERDAAEAAHAVEKKERSVRETNERLAEEVTALRGLAYRADVRADHFDLVNYAAGKTRGLDSIAARHARRDATAAGVAADAKEGEAREVKERLKTEMEHTRIRAAEANGRLERARQAASHADAIRRAYPDLFEDYHVGG